MSELATHFQRWDEHPYPRIAYASVIDEAITMGRRLQGRMPKLAEAIDLAESGGSAGGGGGNPYLRAAGALAQLWKADELGIPQRPSTLGQALVLGSLGGLGGYGVGRALDWLAPNSPVKFSRTGAILGTLAGTAPAVTGGILNHMADKPVMFSSFWDSPDKTASAINVRQFNELVWNTPGLSNKLPPTLQAAASGLVSGASNLPGKVRNSPFVTPTDIARMAVGMGSGAVSGFLAGRALGAFMGLSKSTQQTLTRTGAAAGLLRQVIPLAFGG